MYKVEIITVVGSFIATVPDTIKDSLDALDEIDGCLTELKGAVRLEDGSLLRVWDRTQVVGIRSFEVVDDGVKEVEPDEALQPETVGPWTEPTGLVYAWKEKVKYLGEYRDITVLSYWDGVSKTYFLLYQINGKPAEEFAASSNFKMIVTLWLEQTYQDKGEFEVVIPHGAIEDQEEAVEYLKDYIRETKPEHKPQNKTGKAYTAWNEDRGLK